ncbi:uncharacterized protein B0J16DRAFT_345749 [Fusarium flagelliforme]|uniref:uncharacterized protein n=1 Tax=Fusarium flagelliforme TaxID=2675880 RepID=UPI001E8E1423|nr:uncharacterized protein B0J16DRAFT_345749 [Fusarium flagelliforme]KAH7183397.1 hypothetical protein B0J16DRAFT_345749 [Fusarium flagelliforme]
MKPSYTEPWSKSRIIGSKPKVMLSLRTTISLVLAAVPVVLADTCSKGWETAKGRLCTGGSYLECIAHEDARCLTQCYTIPFGVNKMCLTPCTERNHQICSVWCASVGNCADCMRAFQLGTATGDPKAGRKYCSEEGSDHYFCGCDPPK